MRKGLHFVLGFLTTSALFLAARTLLAVDIVPASMQDIVGALGPDAKGLNISQEALPDLFSLTASRIEENPKQFIVQEPYLDGRWKGGKAVIEYARDLSYTLVSVYDKDGHRQRIYSVRTKFTEHVAHQEAQAPAPEAENVPQETPTSPPVPTPAPTPTPAAVSQPVAVVSSQKSGTPAASLKVGESNAGYEWDEAKGTYVPSAKPADVIAVVPEATPAAASAAAPAPKHHRRHHHEETTVVSAHATTPTSAASTPAGNSPATGSLNGGVWLPSKPKTSDSSAATVKVANTTWVERTPDQPSEDAPKPKRKHKHSKPKPAASSETTTVASSKVTETKAGEEWY